MHYEIYRTTTPERHVSDILVTYHVLQSKIGHEEPINNAGYEIMEACAEGPLAGALGSIGTWSRIWAPLVLGPKGVQKRPEIALFLEVTSRGNLQVMWTPMMSQEEYDNSSGDFKLWMTRLGITPIAQRSKEELYFIRNFCDVEHKSSRQNRCPENVALTNIAITGLASLLAELPQRLSPIVRAYWQSVMIFGFEDGSRLDRASPAPEADDLVIMSAWDHLKKQSAVWLAHALQPIGKTEEELLKAIDDVSVTNPRVTSDEGRLKVVAKRFGITLHEIKVAVKAIESDHQWRDDKSDLWWNRENLYPDYWGG